MRSKRWSGVWITATALLMIAFACESENGYREPKEETEQEQAYGGAAAEKPADREPVEEKASEAAETGDEMAETAAGAAEEKPSETEGMAPSFGTTEDVERAKKLWQEMSGYQDWESYPGFEGWQDGQGPHGKFLKYYLNPLAAENPSDPTDGYVIVKENYPEKDEAKLGPVTVMKKIEGYAPDAGDWFWVKYGPDGSILENEAGMPLAGRVAKGSDQGCIACHANAGGGDYLFAND